MRYSKKFLTLRVFMSLEITFILTVRNLFYSMVDNSTANELRKSFAWITLILCFGIPSRDTEGKHKNICEFLVCEKKIMLI